MLEEDIVKKLEKDLLDLHERIVALEKIEIERQRTGKPHWKTEKEYRSFFQQAKEGMAIVQDGIVIRANSTISQIVGYSPEELIGTPFNQYIHPDELPKVTEYYKERIAGKDAPIIYKLRVMHKDGSEIEIETKMGIVTYNEKAADFAMVNKI
jgi:PAS domain S-box-containing protein